MSYDANRVYYCPVPEFPGYRVGTDGSVWTCWYQSNPGAKAVITDHWKRLKPSPQKGYLLYTLFLNGKRHYRYGHRLVLEAFVGPCPPGKESAHENGVRTDNRLDNLTWKTKLENHGDKRRHGTIVCGERMNTAKLTEAQVREIREQRGKVTIVKLGEKYGVRNSAISKIHLRHTWKHVD